MIEEAIPQPIVQDATLLRGRNPEGPTEVTASTRCNAPGPNEERRGAALHRDQLLDALQRAQADFENYQKRVLRERAEDRRYQHSSFALDLLPVVDDLDRAIDAARHAGDRGPLAQGVELVRKMLLDVLRRQGITPIRALGAEFDPELHHAAMTVDREPAGMIMGVIKEGYRIHERLLRAAEVIVAQPADIEPQGRRQPGES